MMMGILFVPDHIIGQGLSVSPSRIFFQGKQGETITQVITFANHSKGELHFVPNIKDWDRDSLGVKMYYPVGSMEESNGDWLTLNESLIQLRPGEVKEVPLYLNIPVDSSLKSLTHSMLFFTQVKDSSPERAQGLGLNILLEVGIQIYHMPGGLREGEMEFIDFRDDGTYQKDTLSLRRMGVKIQNHSQLNKDAVVRFEMTDLETGEEVPVKAVPIAMLPSAIQWVYQDFPGDLEGRFLVIAILDEGEQYDLKIAEKEVLY